MKNTRTLVSLPAAALAATLSVLSATAAADDAHRLGDHPAVIVKRLEAQRTYDYSAAFYPHPAWLYLETAPAASTVAGDKSAPVPATTDVSRSDAARATQGCPARTRG